MGFGSVASQSSNFQHFLNSIEGNSVVKNQVFKRIQTDERLKGLFELILTDDSWVAHHQGLVMEAINAIYPDDMGFKKIESLNSESLSPRQGVKRVWESAFEEESVSSKSWDYLIKALLNGEFIEAIFISKEINPNHFKMEDFVRVLGQLTRDQRGIFYLSLAHYPYERRRDFFNFIKDNSEYRDPLLPLLTASGDEAEFKEILFSRDSQGITPLITAIKKGEEETVERLLGACSNNRDLRDRLFNTDSRGRDPLRFAVAKKQHRILKLLLEASKEDNLFKVKLFSKDPMGQNPLHFAVIEKDSESVHILMDACGSDRALKERLFSEDMEGLNPLHMAIQENDLQTLMILLKACGNNVGLKTKLFSANEDGMTALHLAAANNNLAMAFEILQAAEGNRPLLKLLFGQQIDGWTALNYAAHHNNLALVRTLIEAAGTDVELKERLFRPTTEDFESDTTNSTPLHFAALEKNVEMAKLLLDSCENHRGLIEKLFQKDSDGFTPLKYAIDEEKPEMIELFWEFMKVIDYPIDVVLSDHETADYLIVKHPKMIENQIKLWGGFEEMNFEQRLNLLPMFSPNQMATVFDGIAIEEIEKIFERKIETEKFTNSVSEYFLRLINDHGLIQLSNENILSVGDTLKEDLKELRFRDFASLAKFYPIFILSFLRLANRMQLASIIPFLKTDLLVEFLRSLSTVEQSYIIGLATTQQKKELLKHLCLVVPETFNRSFWEERIANIEAGIEVINQDLVNQFGAQFIALKTAQQGLKQLQEAYLNNEETSFQKEIEQNFQERGLENSSSMLIQQLKEAETIQLRLNALYAPIREKMHSAAFIDCITEERMVNPILLPKLNPQDKDFWLDKETLDSMIPNDNGYIVHPYNRDILFKREDLKVDQALKKAIEEENETNEEVENDI